MGEDFTEIIVLVDMDNVLRSAHHFTNCSPIASLWQSGPSDWPQVRSRFCGYEKLARLSGFGYYLVWRYLLVYLACFEVISLSLCLRINTFKANHCQLRCATNHKYTEFRMGAIHVSTIFADLFSFMLSDRHTFRKDGRMRESSLVI